MTRQAAQQKTEQTKHVVVIDSGVTSESRFVGSRGLVKSAAQRARYREFIPKSVRVYVRKRLNLVKEIISLSVFSDLGNSVRKEVIFFSFYKSKVEALLGSSFLGGLLQSVQTTEPIQGDIIEFGTFKGGSTVMIGRLLKKMGSKRRIFACDTFEGHPYDDRFTSATECKGEFSDTSVGYVLEKFRRFSVDDRIVIVKGQFEDTLLAKLADERFSLAFIDCDLYDSTKYALDFLHSRMNNGGRIVVHDYADDSWGATRAINEWCIKNDFEVNLDPVPHIEFSHP